MPSAACWRTSARRSRPRRVPLAAAPGARSPKTSRRLRDQPPFPASAMDGYAVRSADVAHVPATLRVIGTAPPATASTAPIGPGEAVRIFTGAPLPDGADCIVIQEDTEALGRARVSIEGEAACRAASSARPGSTSRRATSLLQAGRALDAARHRARRRHGTRQLACPAPARGSRSSPPATNWCGRASRPARTRSPRRALRRLCWRWSTKAGGEGDRSRHRPGHASKPSTSRIVAPRNRGRRHPRHARRRLGRRARSRASGADPPGHGLGFWRVALRPGQTADARHGSARCCCWGCPAIRSPRSSARSCSSFRPFAPSWATRTPRRTRPKPRFSAATPGERRAAGLHARDASLSVGDLGHAA